jgi:tetratricopeptide (TPR) repeat protein
MYKFILLFLGLNSCSICFLHAQENSKVDSIYNNAVSLYQQKEIEKAILEFEKVVIINPRHKDAIFNLAVINYEKGKRDKAIELFQTCVKLKDRKAADFLKKQLGVAIQYADTMLLDDLEISPKILVNSSYEEILLKKGFNKVFEKQIIDAIRKSKLLIKVLRNGRIILDLYFGKDGNLDAKLLGRNKNQIVQAEITSVLHQISIVPGKYMGKEVVAYGIILPVQL